MPCSRLAARAAMLPQRAARIARRRDEKAEGAKGSGGNSIDTDVSSSSQERIDFTWLTIKVLHHPHHLNQDRKRKKWPRRMLPVPPRSD